MVVDRVDLQSHLFPISCFNSHAFAFNPKKISKAHIQQNVINFDCLKCVVGSNVPLDGVNAIENLVDVFKKPIKVHEGYLLNVPFWL